MISCAGLSRLLGRHARLLPGLVLAGGLVVTLVQFALGFRIYYTPLRHTSYWTDLTEGSRNLLAWSPLPASGLLAGRRGHRARGRCRAVVRRNADQAGPSREGPRTAPVVLALTVWVNSDAR